MSYRNRYRNSALAVAIATALYGGVGFAQEKAQTITELEEVIVTGSLIKGSIEESAQAVEVIGEEELQNLGRPSNLDLVKMMSEQGAAPGEANRFNGFPVGAATVNLRNLGSRFTTVVFNNRRFPEQYSTTTGRFNNINWIPNAAIGSVQVLKQGGAVTYGADAVGGVVNYLTRKDLDGFEGNLDYRYIKDSDGDYTADVSWGSLFDNGNFLAVVGYQHRSTLRATDREWSQTGFLENKTTFNWSGSGSPGAYNFQRVPIGGTAPTSISPAGTTGAGTLLGGDRQASQSGYMRDMNCQQLGGFSGWLSTVAPVCYMQTASFENLVEESNQYNVYLEYNAKFSDSLKLHTEGLFYEMDLPNLANHPSDFLASGGAPLVGTALQTVTTGVPGYFASGSNPAVLNYLQNYRNSDGSLVFGDPLDPTSQAYAIVNGGRVGLGSGFWRPFGVGGNPVTGELDKQHNNTKMYRLTTELKGDIPEFWSTQLEWTTAVTYSKVNYSIEANDMLVDRLQAALNGLGGANCTGTTPGANGCQWFNPFSSAIASNIYTGAQNTGYVSSLANDPALVSWMRVPIELTREYEYVWFDGLFSGKTGIPLPGGNVSMALGVQGRYSSELFELDDLSNRAVTPCGSVGVTNCTNRTGALVFGRNANVLGTTTVPPKRKYHVAAAFLETKLPSLSTLDMQIAGRYEKFYSDVSDKDNSVFVPAAAIKWQPFEWIGWRASAGKTFSQVNPPLDDGPTVSGPQTANNTFGGITGYRTANYDNVDVQPMKSQYFSSGFLFRAEGFSANVDYWYINIDDYTRTMSVNNVLQALLADPTAPITAGSALNCSSPLLTTPIAALGGRPFVELGNPCTTLFASINGNSRINYFGATNETNSGRQTSSGIDFSARYRFDNVVGGSLTPAVDGTYNLKWELGDFVLGGARVAQGYDGLGYKNASTGRIGVPIPEWRGSFSLLYTHGKHNLNLVLTYIPSVANENPDDFDASNDQNANIGNASGVTTTGTGVGATCTVGASGLTSTLGSAPAGAGTGEFGAGSVGAPATAALARGFCGNQNVSILSGQKIERSRNIDLTYRVDLTDQFGLFFTIYNLTDEKPSFDRATVAYNSGFGSPLERNYKLGFKAKF